MVHLSQGQEALGPSDDFILQRTGLLQDLRLFPTTSHHFPSPRPSTLVPRTCVCVCVCVYMHARAHTLVQLCPTLCNPMDYTLPDSFVYGIFQARILEWVAISFSRRSQPRDRIHVSRVSCIGRQTLYAVPPGKPCTRGLITYLLS